MALGGKLHLGDSAYPSILERKTFDMEDWEALDDSLNALGFSEVCQTILKLC